jgi:hypothetical protein
MYSEKNLRPGIEEAVSTFCVTVGKWHCFCTSVSPFTFHFYLPRHHGGVVNKHVSLTFFNRLLGNPAPILEMRKQTLRRVKCLDQGHTAGKMSKI